MAANEKTNTEIMKEKFADKEMSAEQLENVSGGSYGEMTLDSRFLNYLLGDSVCRRHDFSEWKNRSKFVDEVERAWAKVGVEAHFMSSDTIKNSYWIGDRNVTRREAFEHAQKVLGKKVKDSDWM
ncbi:MAG: hypothetical protein IKZ66_01400 [Schwartzia sp.]|nr:hypothetical protein [Schwartzia sp. (in: firmicutes)]